MTKKPSSSPLPKPEKTRKAAKAATPVKILKNNKDKKDQPGPKQGIHSKANLANDESRYSKNKFQSTKSTSPRGDKQSRVDPTLKSLQPLRPQASKRKVNPNIFNIKKTQEVGRIISVKDGIAFVSGLKGLKTGEMVSFIGKNIYGMALNLESQQVGCIIFGDDTSIRQGDAVQALNLLVNTPVGHELLGRVVDGLGTFIDGKGIPSHKLKRKNVERKAPGVITRKSVTEPLLTGYKIVDSLLPMVEDSVS